MKELNEKLIISIAFSMMLLGIGFIFLFPSQNNVGAKAPSVYRDYIPIDVRDTAKFNSQWAEAKEQAKGEMFDLFTPPEIYILDGAFVFRPPYAVTPKGPFGINLLEINLDSYRFQLEGFVEENKGNQNKTTILLHSVNDGKTLRLSPYQNVPRYGFKILDWQVIKNFNDEENTEIIAWLKLEDSLTNRIMNLRHDKHEYEDSMEIVFEAAKNNETYVLKGANSHFLVGEVEYRLDSVDLETKTVSMTKSIPGSDPLTKTLSIVAKEKSNPNINNTSSIIKSPTSIQDAFNSVF